MGRPKSFNPDDALRSAMGVFWDKGYEAASVAELTDAMGINRFSLYDTFGDKHELFLQALDLYHRQKVEPTAEKVEAIGSLAELERHFDGMIDYARDPAPKCRCLLQRSSLEMAPSDPETAERVERMFSRMHGAFESCLRRIRATGELCERVRIPEAAWSLLVLQGGIVSMDVAAPPRRAMRAAVRGVLAGLES